ncbi:helix-turn-helix domain-containing protein [Herbaspirillum huttiense]|uniref:helix-turn-helix domain-containing protein n=2 Tax=Herbaspirillum huttiense TaxID=863372 RepID=UPI0028773EF5|nr:helix-turn-helix transcriptional regulator [Herbaspirillum huttiense]
MDKEIYSYRYQVFLLALREMRERAQVTQVGLAEWLGVSQAVVSKSESGHRRMDLAELSLWCNACDVPLATFIQNWEKRL